MTISAHESRLRFVAFRPLDLGAIVTFDRPRNRAVVYTLAGILPIGRKAVELTDIDNIQVRKHENDDGSARYGIILRVKHDTNVQFWCTSRHQAMHIMHETTHFLRLTKTAETSQPLTDLQ